MIKNKLIMIWQFYGPSLPVTLAQQLRSNWYNIGEYLAWFWVTQRFKPKSQKLDWRQWLVILSYLALLGLLVWAVVLLFQAGRWQLATALIITYPMLLTYLLAVPVLLAKLVWLIIHPKQLLRIIVCNLIERQAKHSRQRHSFIIVAVSGSANRASTKSAIAELLESAGLSLRVQKSGHHDRAAAPLALFGLTPPSLSKPLAWLKLIFAMRRAVVAETFNCDVVVVELGTDKPGQLRHFAYLKPDLTVLTSIKPEHMAYFDSLEAVAHEQLTVADYSGELLVNLDDVPKRYLKGVKRRSYSLSDVNADFRIWDIQADDSANQTIRLSLEGQLIKAKIKLKGKPGAAAALAAASVSKMLTMPANSIKAGLSKLKPPVGHAQALRGKKPSTK